VLDRVGFSAGKVHISLLTLLQARDHARRALRGGEAPEPGRRPVDPRTSGAGRHPAIARAEACRDRHRRHCLLRGIDLLGIDLTALTVFSGAFGLAVGFGLQKTFGNLIAGIILLMDRSVKPGDVIVVGDSFGHVTKIGVRAVSIVTRDGKEHLIPNENLMTQEVENWSYSSRDVRVHIPVGIAYDCDLRWPRS
jgi:hypothetical protein